MAKFKILEKSADVTKATVSIANRAKKLDHDIHVVAVSCLYHADKHGDVTLMQNLITALGRSQRKNAVIGWACAYGKFQVDEKGKNVVSCMENTTDLAGAEGESPWDFSPEPVFTAFDLKAELDKLMKRATKAAEDSRNVIDPEQLAQVAKIVGSK